MFWLKFNNSDQKCWIKYYQVNEEITSTICHFKNNALKVYLIETTKKLFQSLKIGYSENQKLT